MFMKNNKSLEILETDELLNKLKNNGYSELIDAILENENKVYTKKGRLNKSGACRVLGWKGKQLEDVLKDCRKILDRELGD